VILASSLLMGVIIYFFVNTFQSRIRDTGDGKTLTLMNCYWFVYGALLKQGFTVDPSSGKKTRKSRA
jgi:hypothetical protein